MLSPSPLFIGKNDRRLAREAFNICFTLPRGYVKKLLLVHIISGRDLLTLEQPNPPPNMFVSDWGKDFSNATFVHYWQKAMASASKYTNGMVLNYFPPSKVGHI
jgi:hypothetical protein